MGGCSLETLQAIRLKMVEASPDANLVINRQGEIIDCNEEAEFLFGYARGDIVGKPVEMLMPVESRDVHAKHVTNFFKSPRRRDIGILGMILKALNRDGEIFSVRIRLAPIVIEGPEGGVYGLAVVRRADA